MPGYTPNNPQIKWSNKKSGILVPRYSVGDCTAKHDFSIFSGVGEHGAHSTIDLVSENQSLLVVVSQFQTALP